MGKVEIYVESKNGHDTLKVEEEEVQTQVEQQLKNDKWVTIEQEDGGSEILAEQDIPCQDDIRKEQEEWAKKFENIKSATATSKAKGG